MSELNRNKKRNRLFFGPPKEDTPKQAAAKLVRDTQDVHVAQIRAAADVQHYTWLHDNMLTAPPTELVPFDIERPFESYARLFNRTAFPMGMKSRLDHALVEVGRDVQVIPGVETGTRRWKLLCLAVSSDLLDQHLEVSFPRLGEAIKLVNTLVGRRGVAFAEVQIVTFTEWKLSSDRDRFGMRDRIELLADKLTRVGVTLEVLTWDINQFDWAPELSASGQPLMQPGTRPCHWRLDRWSSDDP